MASDRDPARAAPPDRDARLRVALDVTPALRQSAGVGRYARDLALALAERGSFDYVPFVADRVSRARLERCLPGGSGRGARSSGVPSRVHEVLWHRLRVPIPAELWIGGVDVYHAMDFLVPPVARAAAVVTVHDLSFLRVPDRAEPSLRRYLAGAVPRSVRDAAHVLVDSECSRRDVTALLGAPEAKVSVAYPGVGAGFRRVLDRETLDRVRSAYGLDRPFVLGVGTLEPRKDWPTLVEAFSRAKRVARDRSLVIAGGRGWRTETIDEALRRASCDVRLLGFVPDDDLPALYSLAEAFAYPSVYEGFGLPPLEAMACGVPTIVSSAASLPEVVGDAAVVVEAGDADALGAALERILTDPVRRDALARAGPARAAAFTWDACAAAAERAYRFAAAGARG